MTYPFYSEEWYNCDPASFACLLLVTCYLPTYVLAYLVVRSCIRLLSPLMVIVNGVIVAKGIVDAAIVHDV